MITATVKAFSLFPKITERVEHAAQVGLTAAAREAAEVAQAHAKHDMKIEVIPAHGEIDGYSAGIKSHRTSDVPGKTTPIATFFDGGTLGKRTKPSKRPRKGSWTQRNPGGNGTHTATRGDIEGKGIEPERFFGKGRAAGRRKLLEQLQRELP